MRALILPLALTVLHNKQEESNFSESAYLEKKKEDKIFIDWEVIMGK